MELINTFTVNLPVGEAWKVLLDLERVARCIPGAAILNVDGDDYHGAVKIKVGPVTTQYKGIARFLEKDETAHRAVIKAAGSDAGGQGNADAVITVSLAENGSGTKVEMRTDLALSGRVAQFGRGVVADVANKILGQFVKNLEADMASGSAGTANTPARPPASAGTRSMDDIEPLDAIGDMGGLIAKYALPAAAGLAAVIGLFALLRSSGKGQTPGFAGPHLQGPGHPGIFPLVVQLMLPGSPADQAPSRTSLASPAEQA